MAHRKRINISLDPASYERLQDIRRKYGFANLCELLAALIRLLVAHADGRLPDLQEDDRAYIGRMFEELCDTGRISGPAPVRRKARHTG